jgi:glycosyltransferase involved in cell wall biosynthesis
LKRYPHLKWISEPDAGQSDALNKSFRQATGDIVGWLTADDLYLPGCFQTALNFLGSRPDIDIAKGD